MRIGPRPTGAALVAFVLGLAPGCADDPASPVEPPVVSPRTGTLQVILSLVGSGAPPDRVLLALDGGQPEPHDGAGPFTLGPLPEGVHLVHLEIPEARCSATLPNASGVVRSGVDTPVELAAECDSIVTGPLTVRTTSEPTSRATEATVTLDGSSYSRITVPGTLTLTRVSSGDHRLTLRVNSTTGCAFHPDTAAFNLGRLPDTLVFALACAPPAVTPTINVDLTMRVLGIGGPSSSLTVFVDGVRRQAAVGRTTTWGTTFGDHEVRLQLPPSCGLGFLDIPKSPNPQRFTLTPESPAGYAWFNVVCIWP